MQLDSSLVNCGSEERSGAPRGLGESNLGASRLAEVIGRETAQLEFRLAVENRHRFYFIDGRARLEVRQVVLRLVRPEI